LQQNIVISINNCKTYSRRSYTETRNG